MVRPVSEGFISERVAFEIFGSPVRASRRPAGTSAAPGQDMMAKLIFIVLGASLIASAGCATESGTGAAVGAGAGGIIGTAAGGAGWGIFGAAVGGLLGYGVGHQVEVENERRMAAALEADQPTTWTPEQGRVYTVQPQPIHYAQGRPCREFTLLAEVDGRPRNVYGTACRQSDGRWEVVSTR